MPSDNDNAITGKRLRGFSPEPTFAGANSFYRRKYSKDLTGVDVAVSGVPLDLAVSHRPGARFGPQAIRQASAILAWERPWPWPFDPFAEMTVIDYGDCYFDPGKPEQIVDAIVQHARGLIAAGVFMLTLGGDHFISYPLIQAHAEAYGPLSLIHFDAHSDTWAEVEPRLDHGTMFYHAAQAGWIVPERSVQVGIRTHNDLTHGFHIFNARQVAAMPAQTIADEIRVIVGDRPAYLTFDIDCLDPAYAPGTGTPVVGGLSSHQALEIIRGLVGVNLKGADVVEVSPPYDTSEITALAAATLAAEILCVLAENRRKGQRAAVRE